MPGIAPLENISDALDTGAKFVRVIADGGATYEQFRRPIDDRTARDNLVAFLKAGCPRFDLPQQQEIATLAIEKPSSTIIKATRPFDPAAIFGSGWTIWLGPEDGSGLTGEVERDPRSTALAEVDLSLVEPTIILRKRESFTTSGEQIVRIKKEKANHIRLDPSFPLTLRSEPEKYPDVWKGKAVFWDGLVLRSPGGDRYSVYSVWDGDGVVLGYRWLDVSRYADDPSALLASKHLAPAT